MNTQCPLFTVKPLSTVRVANVEVKVVRVGNDYHAGTVAHLVDYMELLDHDVFTSRIDADIWMNKKVKELFEACNHAHIPAMQLVG